MGPGDRSTLRTLFHPVRWCLRKAVHWINWFFCDETQMASSLGQLDGHSDEEKHLAFADRKKWSDHSRRNDRIRSWADEFGLYEWRNERVKVTYNWPFSYYFLSLVFSYFWDCVLIFLVFFSWALFHLRQVGLLFTCSSKYAFLDKEAEKIGVNLEEKFILKLGSTLLNQQDNEIKADVCRVQVSNLQRCKNTSTH